MTGIFEVSVEGFRRYSGVWGGCEEEGVWVIICGRVVIMIFVICVFSSCFGYGFSRRDFWIEWSLGV